MKCQSAKLWQPKWINSTLITPLLCASSVRFGHRHVISNKGKSESRSLLRYFSPTRSSPFPHPGDPHQTPRLSPFTAKSVVTQTQCCQGRVPLQALGERLTEDKSAKRNMVNLVNFTCQKTHHILLHSSHTSSNTQGNFRAATPYQTIRVSLCNDLKWKEAKKI